MLAQVGNAYGSIVGQAAGSARVREAGAAEERAGGDGHRRAAGAADGRTGDAAEGWAVGADGTAGGREYRIGELARAAGITVRTLRYYQERKLFPPPRREGRIAWYSRAHLTRLRVIGQLLDRGHTLGGIVELFSAWEQGYDLAELLGFERTMTAPWSDEVPVPVTVEGISGLIGGQITPEDLDAAVRLGYARSMVAASPASAARCSIPRRSWWARASRCGRSWTRAVSCRRASTGWRSCSLSSPPAMSLIAVAARGRVR
jgi:DNA-binding transcriptional MerR regulator